MRRGRWIAGSVALCLPLVFASWLMLSANWSRMDAVTKHLPMPMRSLVADVVAQSRAKGSAQRAKKLDPNVQIPAPLLFLQPDGQQRYETLRLQDETREADSKKWALAGQQQEKAGDWCAAGESYTQAASKQSGEMSAYSNLEHMGRAELRCGDLGSARAALEAAVEKEKNDINDSDSDDDEVAVTKADMQKDREFLVIIYRRQKQEALAKAACSDAHPEWPSCVCILNGNAAVCKGAR